ncbi:MAG: universal stress protein [Chloroflexi bacterium]|nr:universal stress protein [Chloroflexota bacterium]
MSQAASSDEPQPRTILVPLDLTPAGEVKIAVAEEYARALRADVLILHVVRPGDVDPAAVSASEAVARTYLDTIGAYLRGAGIHTKGVLRTGQPAAAIVQEALIHDVCLIILGTNVRPLLSTAVLGSVADQVARTAPCPVLLVRPRGTVMERNQLRCFREDAERAGGKLIQRHLGIRTIEVARIVGSVDRCTELDMNFRPPARRRRKHDEDRFRRIRHAVEESAAMSAIDVYKLGFGYYVLDGHHRVAVALENGQVEIDANVVEYVSAADEQAPERFAARREFERATGLTEVGAARPESYRTLLEAIEQYRREQGLDDLAQAARSWYGDIFRPMWQMIRARQLTTAFPGDRSADLIARLAVWRAAEAPQLDWPEALGKFVETYNLDGTVNVSSRNG